MMIEDEELRNVFKTASEEHLQKLDEGLLYLEQFPDDQDRIEELLREAHSLKGDAGMLGIKDVATLAHQIEHLLGSVKRGEIELSQTISDRLAHGLDAIGKLVNEAITGEPSGITTFHVLAYLMGGETGPQPHQTGTEVADQLDKEDKGHKEDTPNIEKGGLNASLVESSEFSQNSEIQIPTQTTPEPIILPYPGIEVGVPLPYPAIEKAPVNDRPILAQTQHPKSDASLHPCPPELIQPNPLGDSKTTTQQTYRIDTIRVETHHLDSLMTQAGELTVTKTLINHLLTEIEEMVSLCDEWSRDAFVNHLFLEPAESNGDFLAEKGIQRKNTDLSSLREAGKSKSDRKEIWTDNDGMALKQFQHFYHRTEKRLDRLVTLVNRLRTGLYEDTQRLDIIADNLEEGIRTLRLLPLTTIFNLFPRTVRDLARQENKEAILTIEGGETKADKRILEAMKDPLMHMLRNAIDHGIETPSEREQLGKPRTATIQLRGYQTATNIVIEVVDDGRGLDIEKIKHTAITRSVRSPEQLATMTLTQIKSLIFEPGFSTRSFVTQVSGRGVGLDVVRTNVENLKGTIQVESVPQKGCIIRVLLPTTLATAHVLIVVIDEISYAIPVEFVQMARFITPEDIFTIEGRDTILFDSRPISVTPLADLLELSNGNSHSWVSHQQSSFPCLILKVGEELVGLLVDAIVDEQDVMLKPQSQLLKRVRNVSGATILGTGEVCMVLNPQDLIKSVRKQALSHILPRQSGAKATTSKQVILLVEDSITIRTQEKRILEGAGYEVVTAVDGLDAFNKLKARSFDAIVSDIQMPNLDGLELTAKIRQHKEYSELPIILVTSLASDNDKRKGAEAGANAYITKGTFNQEVLLETLRRLV